VNRTTRHIQHAVTVARRCKRTVKTTNNAHANSAYNQLSTDLKFQKLREIDTLNSKK